MSFRRIILLTIGIGLFAPWAYAAQQQDQPSAAEAARKNREEKANQPKPTKVYTNDNIGSAGGPVSVVGQNAPASDSSGTPPAASGAHDKAYWHDKFSAARKKLAEDKKDLDLLQREYNLKQTQYYSDPNQAMKEQYSSDDLKNSKDKIDQRTADVAKDEQAIEDLEDQLRQSGGDPGWARDDDESSGGNTGESQQQENGQSSQSSPGASQSEGSQPPSQDQGSQPSQAPSQTPPPSPQP